MLWQNQWQWMSMAFTMDYGPHQPCSMTFGGSSQLQTSDNLLQEPFLMIENGTEKISALCTGSCLLEKSAAVWPLTLWPMTTPPLHEELLMALYFDILHNMQHLRTYL